MTRRHDDRDRWEIYILQILLAFRPILSISGMILFIYALAALFVYPEIGILVLFLALSLFLLVTSDRAALFVARAGSWVVTFGRN